MNRSKLFIIIFIAFILIVITIVLLACTVFIVRDVTIEKAVASDRIDEERIIETSGLSVGRSIISISKDKIKASIEKENPDIEVLSITREFPNKVVVKVTVRAGVMVVSSSSGDYNALVDASMKVLDILPSNEPLKGDATVVSGATFEMPEGGAELLLGTKLTLNKPVYGDIISEIADFTSEYDLEAARFTRIYKEISFTDVEGGTKVYIRTIKKTIIVLDTTMTSSVYDQLYRCMYLYVTSDRTGGYITFDKSQNSFAWLDTLD